MDTSRAPDGLKPAPLLGWGRCLARLPPLKFWLAAHYKPTTSDNHSYLNYRAKKITEITLSVTVTVYNVSHRFAMYPAEGAGTLGANEIGVSA